MSVIMAASGWETAPRWSHRDIGVSQTDSTVR